MVLIALSSLSGGYLKIKSKVLIQVQHFIRNTFKANLKFTHAALTFHALFNWMHKSWRRTVAEECLQTVHIVLLPHMEPINTNKMLSCRRMRLLLWKTEFVTSFILRELNFHTNSQCSRMCKGRLNTVHHPWFPWRPWSLYDNRIPTIAVKTLIPSKLLHENRAEEFDCLEINTRREETLCTWASLQGQMDLFITTAAE